MTAADFAAALGISIPTAYRYLALAGITATGLRASKRRGPKAQLFPVDAVERYRAWLQSSG